MKRIRLMAAKLLRKENVDPAESLLPYTTRPTHWRTDANLYPPERKLTKASEPSFDLEGGAKG